MPLLGTELEQAAQTELAKLMPRLATLTLRDQAESEGEPGYAEVRVSIARAEGRGSDPDRWQIAIPLLRRGLALDPGQYEVVLTAKGRVARSLQIEVGEGQQTTVVGDLSLR